MAQKKYASYSTVQSIVNNIKNLFVSKDEHSTHTSNADIHFSAPERTKLTNIEAGAQVNTITGVKGNSESTYRTGNVNITKANIGLGNVDNTSDANKPVSTAQQTAIDTALSSAKSYADTKTSGLASSSSVTSAVSTHNTAEDAHNDIRVLISTLTDRLNTVANSTDTDLDQLAEIVAYIKDNKSLIEGVTTNKVNTSDIINNLTTNSTSKVLAAAQGVAIKKLIDDLAAAVDTQTHTVSEITDLTATATELNYMDGVTSNVQTQLDSIRADHLPLAGGTVTGTTVFSKVQDAVANAYNEPAVVIGGNPDQAHLELDNNEIQAKGSKTTAGNLFLNSNGGTVHVGFGGLKVDSEGVIIPEEALSSSVGTDALPFNRMYGRYFELYGAANTQYGRFRVGTTGTTSTAGVTTLELGNNKATGTANNASGKVTMYGSGTGFTNILPNTNTSGSNEVRLPTGSGTLALVETSTKMAPMTTAEYNALTNEQIDAHTLYMITDEEDEDFVTQEEFDVLNDVVDTKAGIQIITWEAND